VSNSSETSNSGERVQQQRDQQQREQQDVCNNSGTSNKENRSGCNSNNTLSSDSPRRSRTRVRKLPAQRRTRPQLMSSARPQTSNALGVERKIILPLACKRYCDKASRIETVEPDLRRRVCEDGPCNGACRPKPVQLKPIAPTCAASCAKTGLASPVLRGDRRQRWLLRAATRRENSRQQPCGGRPGLGRHSVPDRAGPSSVCPARAGSALLVRILNLLPCTPT